MLKIRVILLSILFVSLAGFSQNNEINQNELTGSDSLEQEFRTKYNIAFAKGIRSKIMADVEMRSEPSAESEKLGVVIPRDSITCAYKYFNAERCWAVKYHDTWGFVQDDVVFPVFGNTVEKTMSKYDEPPQLKTAIKPVYPAEAEKKGIKGKVYVKVFIDETGAATDAIILDGIEELNEAAIDAVKKAKYKPARLEGKEVGVWVNLSINFS